MAKVKQALRPEIFSIPGFINDEKANKEGVSAEEQILAAGSDNLFWKTLKKHIDNSIEQLEQVNENAIAQGASFEQIGQNTLVISQVKGVLSKIFNIVQDASDAVEEANLKDNEE